MADEPKEPTNGKALALFEDTWDSSPITTKRQSAVPTVRAYLTASSELRKACVHALQDPDGVAGAVWAAKARVYELVVEYDQGPEGHNALQAFSMEQVWNAANKVIKERTPKGFLVRGRVNFRMLQGPSQEASQ